jgi:hypothetical protein
VRPEAAFDRYYTVLRVHAGDAILTDNWHTNEVLDHARNNFEGYTFAMRTLEAWGAMIENDHRGYYTAGGRVWVMDLEPCEGKKPRLAWRRSRQEVGTLAPHPAHRRHAGDCRAADVCAA